MALRCFLFPIDGSQVDEDGNPFPITGLRVQMTPFYEEATRDGLLVRRDPSGVTALTQPAVYSPHQLGGLAISLPSTAALVIGEVRRVYGYSGENDGGEGSFRAVSSVGLTIDNGVVFASATAGIYWQRIHLPSYVSARWFGAGLGASGDAAAITLAHDAVAAGGGGTLHLPEGTYTWDATAHLSLGDNVWLRGDGRGTKWLRNTAYGAINVFGVDGWTVSDMTIEMDFFINFVRLIDGYGVDGSLGCSNGRVDNVRMHLTEDAAASIVLGSNTLHACLFDNANDISVTNCSFKYLQVKLATFGSAYRMRVEGNYFDHPVDFAASCVVSGVTTEEMMDIVIRGNIVNLPEASGTFYVGHDSEAGRIAKMERIAIEDNIVMQDRELGGVQVLVHLGDVSKDISISRNILTNKSASHNGSYLIRVRSTGSGRSIDGLRIAGNILNGCDHAGISTDCHGRNIVIEGNVLNRTRGIYVWAMNGDLDCVSLEGNVCSYNGHHGIWAVAESGDLTDLSIEGGAVSDAAGAALDQNAGVWLQAASGKTVKARVRGLRVKNRDLAVTGSIGYHIGPGSIEAEYTECDSTNLPTFVNVATGGSAPASSFVIGHSNRGYGAPDVETVTARIADASAAGDTDVKARCAGAIVRIKTRLSAALTGADAVLTTKIQPAAGGGYTNITSGVVTVTQSGSAAGDLDFATPSAANIIGVGDSIRVSCDGGPTNPDAVPIDVTYYVDRSAA